MDADFSIELGDEDPVLDFPWKDPSGKLAYVDVKHHPALMTQIEEIVRFPELKEFLSQLNSPQSLLETAKCDAWSTEELSLEEEIYEAKYKFATYVDVVFVEACHDPNAEDLNSGNQPARHSFAAHEQFARKLVELLHRVPDTSSSAEIGVRRCYYEDAASSKEGFYCTLYVNGYGGDEESARQNWAAALNVTANVISQMWAWRS